MESRLLCEMSLVYNTKPHHGWYRLYLLWKWLQHIVLWTSAFQYKHSYYACLHQIGLACETNRFIGFVLVDYLLPVHQCGWVTSVLEIPILCNHFCKCTCEHTYKNLTGMTDESWKFSSELELLLSSTKLFHLETVAL